MVSFGEKAKIKKAGNLNLGRSYVVTTVILNKVEFFWWPNFLHFLVTNLSSKCILACLSSHRPFASWPTSLQGRRYLGGEAVSNSQIFSWIKSTPFLSKGLGLLLLPWIYSPLYDPLYATVANLPVKKWLWRPCSLMHARHKSGTLSHPSLSQSYISQVL